jgi:uncharacterized protein YigA (DUF484 family)
MTTDEIARFLRTHPHFFDQHPELLESIQVPHPYGGRAIPLSERQTVALREKVRLLEGRLAEIIKFAEENDAISEKVHRLSVALTGARDFPALSICARISRCRTSPCACGANRCRSTSRRPRR